MLKIIVFVFIDNLFIQKNLPGPVRFNPGKDLLWQELPAGSFFAFCFETGSCCINVAALNLAV